MDLPGPAPVRRADQPLAEVELDTHLKRAVRRAAAMRQGFYVVVLLVALAGQVSGAVEALHIPVAVAAPAVAALELGGIVVMGNADVRRRLGERALASRILSAAIAGGAVAFNWLAHTDHLMGGFFAGMSALGYLVWLMHTENSRRDRLRAKGTLPPTSPAYEVLGHWIRHPGLTLRAKALSRARPGLGLYDSLAQARRERAREERERAIAKVLHRKIRAAVDPTTADIAVAVYDLDEIAKRLTDRADYDGLTALIGTDLLPSRLAGVSPDTGTDLDAEWADLSSRLGHTGPVHNGVPAALTATWPALEPSGTGGLIALDPPRPVPGGEQYAQVGAAGAAALCVPGTAGAPGTDERGPVPAPRRPDSELLAMLRQPRRVPRDPDGTVPIRRAARTLRCGPDRARRLLAEAGLLRTDEGIRAEIIEED